MQVRLLTERELRTCVEPSLDALEVVERGFTELSAGRVVQPPILRVDVKEKDGEVDVKSAYVPGEPSFAVKLSSGFFQNHRLGLPSSSGMMILISAQTGRPEALLLDNGYLTDVRTALAGAIAAKHLAPRKALRVGVVGTGGQARHQLNALALVRDVASVRVCGRDRDRLDAYVAEMGERFDVRAAESVASLAASSDVVITTTPAKSPLLSVSDLHPGLHITAMGSDAEEKQELAAEIPGAVDLFVCDHRGQSTRLGELRAAVAAGYDAERAVELGTITEGRHPGRTNEDEVTVCDLTGTGVQDTMIARLAYQRALDADHLGTSIEV